MTCGRGPCGRDDCRVCWWGRQPQPETLFEKLERLERERRLKAMDRKQKTVGEFNERYQKRPELPTKVRTDPTKRPRQRKGPNYVSPSAWVAPPMTSGR